MDDSTITTFNNPSMQPEVSRQNYRLSYTLGYDRRPAPPWDAIGLRTGVQTRHYQHRRSNIAANHPHTGDSAIQTYGHCQD